MTSPGALPYSNVWFAIIDRHILSNIRKQAVVFKLILDLVKARVLKQAEVI